jgi:hypothetical protein
VDSFYTATKPRSRGASWSIFAPALILVGGASFRDATIGRIRVELESFKDVMRSRAFSRLRLGKDRMVKV